MLGDTRTDIAQDIECHNSQMEDITRNMGNVVALDVELEWARKTI